MSARLYCSEIQRRREREREREREKGERKLGKEKVRVRRESTGENSSGKFGAMCQWRRPTQ